MRHQQLAKERSEIRKRRELVSTTSKAMHEACNNVSYTNSRRRNRHGSRLENLEHSNRKNHNILPDIGRSLPDQAFDTTQDSKKVRVHPTDPAKTTSITVNLDPA
jgi:hypothetical protein